MIIAIGCDPNASDIKEIINIRMENNMKDMKIAEIKAREIIDCRGLPTLEVDVVLQSGRFGRVGVPAGRSTSQHEAVELRDNEKRFDGLGVRKAMSHVNGTIAKALIGMDASQQREIDTFMTKTGYHPFYLPPFDKSSLK